MPAEYVNLALPFVDGPDQDNQGGSSTLPLEEVLRLFSPEKKDSDGVNINKIGLEAATSGKVPVKEVDNNEAGPSGKRNKRSLKDRKLQRPSIIMQKATLEGL
ncbi:hypothetical protein TKK_0016633 [Trichogramma kaykai]